jgi:hypothetical protein
MRVKILNQSDDEIYLWKQIVDMPIRPNGQAILQDLEDIMNTHFLDLFFIKDDTEEYEHQHLLCVDDDKAHCNYKSTTETDCIRKDHHAKDNSKDSRFMLAATLQLELRSNVGFQGDGIGHSQ